VNQEAAAVQIGFFDRRQRAVRSSRTDSARRVWSGLGQKCPKRLRLPPAKPTSTWAGSCQFRTLRPTQLVGYSINSSALACSVSGTVSPSGLGGLEVDDQHILGRLGLVGGCDQLRMLQSVSGRMDRRRKRRARHPRQNGEMHRSPAADS